MLPPVSFLLESNFVVVTTGPMSIISTPVSVIFKPHHITTHPPGEHSWFYPSIFFVLIDEQTRIGIIIGAQVTQCGLVHLFEPKGHFFPSSPIKVPPTRGRFLLIH